MDHMIKIQGTVGFQEFKLFERGDGHGSRWTCYYDYNRHMNRSKDLLCDQRGGREGTQSIIPIKLARRLS